MIHHILLILIFLILNLLISNLFIFQSQRDVDEFLSNFFWSLQTVLDVMLLMLFLLLQSFFLKYLWVWYVTLADRIIEEGNQTDLNEEE